MTSFIFDSINLFKTVGTKSFLQKFVLQTGFVEEEKHHIIQFDISTRTYDSIDRRTDVMVCLSARSRAPLKNKKSLKLPCQCVFLITTRERVTVIDSPSRLQICKSISQPKAFVTIQ